MLLEGDAEVERSGLSPVAWFLSTLTDAKLDLFVRLTSRVVNILAGRSFEHFTENEAQSLQAFLSRRQSH